MRISFMAVCGLLLSGCIRPRPSYNGYAESINCVAIQGWAIDWNRYKTPVIVGLYDGDKLLAKITADRLRPDLQGSSKNHGFLLTPAPAVLFDRKPHIVHLRYGDSKRDLPHSPKPLVCPG